MNKKILASYKNGGVDVTIFSDGTKIREGSNPGMPESIDLKITDYCNAGCKFCHENSTISGSHGDLDFIKYVISQMIKGSEVAIGGGNPLSHPDIEEILEHAKKCGVIANITVNAFHIARYGDMINSFRNRKLIYGLGISYNKALRDKIKQISDDNTIIHFISGIHDPVEMMFNNKILILGYKTWGRGSDKEISSNALSSIEKLREFLPVIENSNKVICFDNLALDQLKINVNDDNRYMGDEGSHTMYVDAVKKEYCISSYLPDRFSFNNLKDSFNHVRIIGLNSGNSMHLPIFKSIEIKKCDCEGIKWNQPHNQCCRGARFIVEF